MTIATYDELEDAVENWLARTDQAARTEEFIDLAEAEINRRLEIREMETRSTATLGSGDEYIALPTTPTNFLRLERLLLQTDPRRMLTFRPAHQLVFEYPNQTTGRPEAYAMLDDSIQVRPISDASYTIEAVYFARLSAITASNTPRLFTQNPDLYLYGALSHAIPYINEPDTTNRLTIFRGYFEKAIQEQRLLDMRARYSGAPLTIRSDVGAP